MDKPTSKEVAYYGAVGGMPIIIHPGLLGETTHRARTHKKRRIDKKWRKRYGYKRDPDKNIYVTEVNGRNAIMMHPKVFKLFVKRFGSEEVATEAITKYFKED